MPGQNGILIYSPWCSHYFEFKTLLLLLLSHPVMSDCDPIDGSIRGFPVLHYFPELAQIHVHWVNDAIQPIHPLPSPSPPALNLSQHQGLFQWVSSSHQVARVLEIQLQHQSFQWTFRVDFLNIMGISMQFNFSWKLSFSVLHCRQQNLPPQNVSLACSLFQGENNQGSKDSGKTLIFPLIA